MTLRTIFLASAASLMILPSAYAQQAPSSAQRDDGTPKAARAKATRAEEATVVDALVVTADRRAQTVQKYAGTAAVISGDDLKKVGISNLSQLNDSLPGVTISNTNEGINVYIRGIGTNNNTELGDPAAATLFDDVYIPRTAGLGPAFFDVKAIEVNYGPQGTLRGRNSTAGSINVTSYPPLLGKFEGQLGGGAGNYGHLEGFGFVNLPVGDRIALRISGNFNSHSAYDKNVGPITSTPAPEQADDRGVRAQVLFKPVDRLSLLFAGDYNQSTGTGYFGTNFSEFLGIQGGLTNQANQVKDPRAVILGPVAPFANTKHYGFRNNIRWQGDGLVSAELTSSYRVVDQRFGGAGPIGPFYPGYIADLSVNNGPNAVAAFDNYSQALTLAKSKSIYEEFRLFNDTAPFVYSLGVNYFHEEQKNFLGGVSDDNPFFQGLEFNTRTKSRAYGAFADATYSVTPRLRLTGGIRYTNDQKSRTGVAARYGFALGDSGFGCCMPLRLGTPGFQFAAFDRTIFNPDTNNDGAISNQEALNFYLNGVKSFGNRDNLLPAFSNAIAAYNAGNPNSTAGGPGCYNSYKYPQGSCAANGNYTYAVPLSGQIFQQQGSVQSSFVDWRGRAEFDLADHNLLYVLVSRGHKSAGFNDNLGNLGFAPTYRPESVTLFEAGSKNLFYIDGRPLILNGTIFYNRYKDQQLSALLSVQQIITSLGPTVTLPPNSSGNLVVSYTFNAATDETYGAQLSGSIVLPGNFKFGLDALVMNARVAEAAPIQDFISRVT